MVVMVNMPPIHDLSLKNLLQIQYACCTGLLAIYSYTMFNFLMNDCLEGNSKRFVFTIRSNHTIINIIDLNIVIINSW